MFRHLIRFVVLVLAILSQPYTDSSTWGSCSSTGVLSVAQEAELHRKKFGPNPKWTPPFAGRVLKAYFEPSYRECLAGEKYFMGYYKSRTIQSWWLLQITVAATIFITPLIFDLVRRQRRS